MARLRQSDKTEALEKIPLFEGLSKKELVFLARLVTEAHFLEGTVLAKQGVLGREAMVIMSGTAVVHRNNRKVAELGPGDVLGEMSLVNRVHRNATVTASTDVTVLVMDSREFSSVLDSNPKVSVKLLKTVAARLVENQGGTI